MNERRSHGIVVAVTTLVGIFLLALGVWALTFPSSFYDQIALFSPYNRHLIHDAGAFQVGLGATLLLALRWRDALFVSLTGVGVGAAIHALVHAIDHDLGGRRSDPYALGLLAAALIIAALLRWRSVRMEGP